MLTCTECGEPVARGLDRCQTHAPPFRAVTGKPGAWIVPDPARPRCCYCGADESHGPLDPRSPLRRGPRCVDRTACDLRAELRDVTRAYDEVRAELRAAKAEIARLTEETGR